MKRIIPKSSKVKMEIIKGFSLKDLILALFLLLMTALLLFSNLHNKFLYIAAIILLAILIILPVNGRKMYEELLACLRYIFSKKKFVHKYSKPIHKKAKQSAKKADGTINFEEANASQHATAEGAEIESGKLEEETTIKATNEDEATIKATNEEETNSSNKEK